MKQKIMYVLSLITVIVIVTFVGKKGIVPSAFKSNNLLMQNVEALAGEEIVVYSECMGSCTYSEVSYSEGQTTERTQWSDSLDMVRTVDYRICVSKGRGNLCGTNYDLAMYGPATFEPRKTMP